MTERKIPSGNKSKLKVNDKSLTQCEILGPTIIDLIRAGMRPSTAAQAAGMSKQAVSNWIKRGIEEQFRIENGEDAREEEQPYLKFVNDMAKAESEAQAALVLSWFREARQGDWKAAQAFLAKRWPDEWGDSNTVRVEVSGAGGGPIQAQMKHSLQEDDERKRAVLEALVESGDLPSNVLNAWDGVIDAEVVDEHEGPTVTVNELEETMRVDSSSQSTPETAGVSDMDDD
jgi:hypothetical protein